MLSTIKDLAWVAVIPGFFVYCLALYRSAQRLVKCHFTLCRSAECRGADKKGFSYKFATIFIEVVQAESDCCDERTTFGNFPGPDRTRPQPGRLL